MILAMTLCVCVIQFRTCTRCFNVCVCMFQCFSNENFSFFLVKESNSHMFFHTKAKIFCMISYMICLGINAFFLPHLIQRKEVKIVKNRILKQIINQVSTGIINPVLTVKMAVMNITMETYTIDATETRVDTIIIRLAN